MFKRLNFIDSDVLKCKTNNTVTVQRNAPEFSIRGKIIPKNKNFEIFTSTFNNEGRYTAVFSGNGTVSTVEPKLNDNLKVVLKVIQSSSLLCEFFMSQKFDFLNGTGRLVAEYKECQPNIEFEYTKRFGNNNLFQITEGKVLSGMIAHFGENLSYGFNFNSNKFSLDLHAKREIFDFFTSYHFSTSIFLPKLVSELTFVLPQNSSDSPIAAHLKSALAFNLKTKFFEEDLGEDENSLPMKRNNFNGKLLVSYKQNSFTAFTSIKGGFYSDIKPTFGLKLNLRDGGKAICALSYSDTQKFRYTFGYTW